MRRQAQISDKTIIRSDAFFWKDGFITHFLLVRSALIKKHWNIAVFLQNCFLSAIYHSAKLFSQWNLCHRKTTIIAVQWKSWFIVTWKHLVIPERRIWKHSLYRKHDYLVNIFATKDVHQSWTFFKIVFISIQIHSVLFNLN